MLPHKITVLSIILISQYIFHRSQACTNQTAVNCSTITSSTRLILVWGLVPTGNCASVQIGSTSFVFDPIMINYAWITINNTVNGCISDIASRAQALTLALNYLSTQEIILLNVTDQYYRMVLVTKSCTTCPVFPFTPDLEARLKNTNLQLYPVFNNLNTLGQYCLYNGSINPNYTGAGYDCTCPVSSTFVGPSCEIMEAVIQNTQTYFNIFRNATIINLRFSFFSKGITGLVSLFTIKNSTYQRIVEVIINQSTIILNTQDSYLTSNISVLDNQKWHDFIVVVTQQNVSLMIDSLNISANFTANIGSTDFRSFYLMINEGNSVSYSICMKNLIINSKIIDLNSPTYTSCCTSRCSCSPTQICNCSPFMSLSFSSCYCEMGFVPVGGNCVPNNISLYQMPSNRLAVFPVNSQLGRIDFGFRTLSTSGSLLTLNLSNPPTNIVIQIVSNNLTMTVANETPRRITYNVSDGQIHNVSLTLKLYSLELNLDYNENYTNYFSNWFTSSGFTSISISSFMLGPMQLPFNSTINNLTTCFSIVRLNGTTNGTDLFPSTNANISVPCSNGPRCSPGNNLCPNNLVCKDNEWQNTKCICETNFTLENGTSKCKYNQCIVNPCLNGGECYYVVNASTFSCNCPPGYTGTLCVTVTSALWWIAVLVVLVFLLIILIILVIYCCYNRNRTVVNAYISKINENIVIYNEQAGECDYIGPPIDFNLMKTALKDAAPVLPLPGLMNTKEALDKNNDDLILDHPLEYGYEGYDSDNGSMSSIGSKSVASENNVPPLEVDNYFNDINERM